MRRVHVPGSIPQHSWDPYREHSPELVQMASEKGHYVVIGITDGGLVGSFLNAQGECADPSKARTWAQQLVRGNEPYDSAVVIDGMGHTLFHTDDSVH